MYWKFNIEFKIKLIIKREKIKNVNEENEQKAKEERLNLMKGGKENIKEEKNKKKKRKTLSNLRWRSQKNQIDLRNVQTTCSDVGRDQKSR